MRQSNLAPAIAKDGTDQVQTHHRRHHGEEGAEKATERGSRKSTPPHARRKHRKRRYVSPTWPLPFRKKAPITCNATTGGITGEEKGAADSHQTG